MKKILVIEDDASYRKMLVSVLEDEGYEVESVEDGIAGCERCFNKTYDLVITDLFLPGKDGVQTIHELKEEFSSDIKIIAISGACSEGRTREVLDLSKNHGADRTFQKPFKVADLVKTVEELLREDY